MLAVHLLLGIHIFVTVKGLIREVLGFVFFARSLDFRLWLIVVPSTVVGYILFSVYIIFVAGVGYILFSVYIIGGLIREVFAHGSGCPCLITFTYAVLCVFGYILFSVYITYAFC